MHNATSYAGRARIAAEEAESSASTEYERKMAEAIQNLAKAVRELGNAID